MTVSTPVRFSFDPSCPWTWRTSRWLVAVAAEADLSVEWRAFSLRLLSSEEPEEPKRSKLLASMTCLRVIEALHAAGRNDDAGRLYTEVGTRVHERGEALTEALVADAVTTCGLDHVADAMTDTTWDAAVRASHERAFAAAGPDIGSPVLEVAGAERGLHGPVLAEVPPLSQSLTIWECVARLVACPAFFELKRGRS